MPVTLTHPDKPGTDWTVPDEMVEHAMHTGWVPTEAPATDPADPDQPARRGRRDSGAETPKE